MRNLCVSASLVEVVARLESHHHDTAGLDVVKRHLVVELRCGHKFCADCLQQCAARGMTTCLSCREPHELSPLALRARYHDFRTGYRNWRVGAAKGARGEPSELFLKPAARAPVTIWLFWDSETMPSVVQACIASWKRWNQHVILITPKTVGNYVQDWPDLSFESSRAKVNWIGLTLVEERGGIWVDASTWCTAPVETWLCTDRSKVTLFASRHHSHIYEPWMVASPRAKHPLVIAWRQELSVAQVVGAQSYVDAALKTCDGLQWCDMPRHIDLCCHFALLVAFYDEPQLESHVNAYSADTGPCSRAHRFHGDPELIVKDLATQPLKTATDSIMIKFDQREVEAVQRRLDACHFEAGSALHVLFDYLSDNKDTTCPFKEAYTAQHC